MGFKPNAESVAASSPAGWPRVTVQRLPPVPASSPAPVPRTVSSFSSKSLDATDRSGKGADAGKGKGGR